MWSLHILGYCPDFGKNYSALSCRATLKFCNRALRDQVSYSMCMRFDPWVAVWARYYLSVLHIRELYGPVLRSYNKYLVLCYFGSYSAGTADNCFEENADNCFEGTVDNCFVENFAVSVV